MKGWKVSYQEPTPDRGHAYEKEVRETLLQSFGRYPSARSGNLLINIPHDKSAFFQNIDAKIFPTEGGLTLQAEIDAAFYVKKATEKYTLFGHDFRIKDDSVVAFEITCSKDSLDKYARKCVQIAILSQLIALYPFQVFGDALPTPPKHIYFFLLVEDRQKIMRCLKKSVAEQVSKKVKQALTRLSFPECDQEAVNRICVLGTKPDRRPKRREATDSDYFILRKDDTEFEEPKNGREKERKGWSGLEVVIDNFEPKVPPKKQKKKNKKQKKSSGVDFDEGNERDLLSFPPMTDEERNHIFLGSSGKVFPHSPKSSIHQEKSEDDGVTFFRSRTELNRGSSEVLDSEIQTQIRLEAAVPPYASRVRSLSIPQTLPDDFQALRLSSLVSLIARRKGSLSLQWPAIQRATVQLAE